LFAVAVLRSFRLAGINGTLTARDQFGEPVGSTVLAQDEETRNLAVSLAACLRSKRFTMVKPLGNAPDRSVSIGILLRYGQPAQGLIVSWLVCTWDQREDSSGLCVAVQCADDSDGEIPGDIEA